MIPPPPRSTLFPYTTLFRSLKVVASRRASSSCHRCSGATGMRRLKSPLAAISRIVDVMVSDRKSTRLNSSHQIISYAVFCLKKKENTLTDCIEIAASGHDDE